MRFSFVAMKTAKIHWNYPLSLGILDIHSLPSPPLAPLPFHITVQQKVCSLRRSHVMAGNGIVMRTSSKIQLVQDQLKWKSVWKIRPNVSFMAAIWESNLYGNGPAINENRDHNGEKHGLLISTLPLGPELPSLKEMQRKHHIRENN